MTRRLRCRVCGVPASFEVAFEKLGFRGNVMRYERCSDCGSLLCTDPTWLEQAYARADDANDPGAPARAQAVARLIGAFRPRDRWLDYGAGRGLLADLVPAVTSYDPFRQGMQTWTTQTFDGASMVEVLEHLMEPEKDLRRIAEALLPSSPLLVTTNLYDVGYDATWPYLASDLGQHVTFPSKRGLHLLAERCGLSWPLFARPIELAPLEIHILFKPPFWDLSVLESRILAQGFHVERMA